MSHGQPSDPTPAEVALAELTARVSTLLPGWTLASATLAASGALDAAVAKTGRDALIYPLFMTDGWFTRTTLPKRLGNADACILPPLGVDPALPFLARDWLVRELDRQGWQASDTCLIIAAHGSGKSRNSARDTERFAGVLSDEITFASLRVGYIEEPPYLGDVAFDAGQKALCLPFFAAAGGHVADDIPEALNLADFQGVRLDPIGCHPGIPALIAAALQTEAKRMAVA